MSAFDDEFGLFGDEEHVEDERRSTLGARKIATGGETIIDEIEPEDEGASRRRMPLRGRRAPERTALADEIVYPRALDLLSFLVKKLVSKPETVAVTLHPLDRGAVLKLSVDPEDMGKIIGRGGRIAQGLRTLVRACSEGRVTVDIADKTSEAGEGGAHEAASAPGEDHGDTATLAENNAYGY